MKEGRGGGDAGPLAFLRTYLSPRVASVKMPEESEVVRGRQATLFPLSITLGGGCDDVDRPVELLAMGKRVAPRELPPKPTRAKEAAFIQSAQTEVRFYVDNELVSGPGAEEGGGNVAESVANMCGTSFRSLFPRVYVCGNIGLDWPDDVNTATAPTASTTPAKSAVAEDDGGDRTVWDPVFLLVMEDLRASGWTQPPMMTQEHIAVGLRSLARFHWHFYSQLRANEAVTPLPEELLLVGCPDGSPADRLANSVAALQMEAAACSARRGCGPAADGDRGGFWVLSRREPSELTAAERNWHAVCDGFPRILEEAEVRAALSMACAPCDAGVGAASADVDDAVLNSCLRSLGGAIAQHAPALDAFAAAFANTRIHG